METCLISPCRPANPQLAGSLRSDAAVNCAETRPPASPVTSSTFPFTPRTRLTQQDEDAGQDGDERPSAQAGGEAVGLGVAQQDGALLVAAAHGDGERAGAGVLAVGDGDGQVKDFLLLLRPASAARQDPRRVVWGRQL